MISRWCEVTRYLNGKLSSRRLDAVWQSFEVWLTRLYPQKEDSLIFSSKLPNGAVVTNTFEFNSRTEEKSLFGDKISLFKV